MIAPHNHQGFFDHDSDVALMQRVREGDSTAFVQLMERHRKYVRWTLSQFVPHHHDIEDLLQDVFLRVFRACGTYQPQAKLTTWLFTIARNVALNSLRKKSRRCEKVLHDDGRYARFDKALAAPSNEIPNQLAERSEVQAVVRVAISQLSPRQQRAVQLAYDQGMSHRAIAGSMDTTPEAVKSLLRRTRCNLRDSLLPYLNDGTLPAGSNA